GSATSDSSSHVALARHLPDGALDPQFGNGGVTKTEIDGSVFTEALFLQADGKMMVTGAAGKDPGYDFFLARYDRYGQLDRTFGQSGLVVSPFAPPAGRVAAAALSSDGKIVAAGDSRDEMGRLQFALARYLTTRPSRPRLAVRRSQVR